jgi:OsmC-like protein
MIGSGGTTRSEAMEQFSVVVGAGSRRSALAGAVRFAHRWTPEGVTVEADFTGAHLLHLSVAGCVLNDLYREAGRVGIAVDGVRVRAHGGFDAGTWTSTGIAYAVEVDAPSASAEQIAGLLDTVDAVAEIPRALRPGARVVRTA